MLSLTLRKKRIIAFTKTVWPEDQPAPWFRGNTKNTKKLMEIVDQLGQDETYMFSKGGLGSKTIERNHTEAHAGEETQGE